MAAPFNALWTTVIWQPGSSICSGSDAHVLSWKGVYLSRAEQTLFVYVLSLITIHISEYLKAYFILNDGKVQVHSTASTLKLNYFKYRYELVNSKQFESIITLCIDSKQNNTTTPCRCVLFKSKNRNMT